MTSRAFRLSVSCLLIAVSGLGFAENALVLSTTYDVRLSIDDHDYRVSSRALVRSGNEIPNLLQDFKIELCVSRDSPDDFVVQIIVYEKDGANWRPIIVPYPQFRGKLGTPTEYVWESGGMKLDAAIVVGVRDVRM